jgi:hypothetical protein
MDGGSAACHESFRAPRSRILATALVVIVSSLLVLGNAQAQPRTNPRLYPWDGTTGDRIGDRRLFRENPADKAEKRDGIILEWSEKTVPTAAGPRVPARVRIRELLDDGTTREFWTDGAPYYIDKVLSSKKNLSLRYFDDQDRVVARLSVRDEMHAPDVEIKRRLAAGDLWLLDNVTPGQLLSDIGPADIPLTAEQVQSVASVLWESWVDDDAANAAWVQGVKAKLLELQIDSPPLADFLASPDIAKRTIKITGSGRIVK